MEEEPVFKKPRLEENKQMWAILADEFTQNVTLTSVIVCRVDNKKQLSTIMQELSQKVPLPMSLQHLKRVREQEIIICKASELPENDIENAIELKTKLKKQLKSTGCSEKIVMLLCSNVKVHDVPSTPIKLRWQYESIQQHWPCKFHPNAYLESLYNGNNFSPIQVKFHLSITSLAVRLSNDLESHKPVGICVDPRIGTIVAMASSHSHMSPVMHCPMVLIDFVARTQDAGSWNLKEWVFMKDESGASVDNDKYQTMRGILRHYYYYISNKMDNGKDFKFGSELLNEVRTNSPRPSDIENTVNNLSKFGPYLCTGYDVYLSHEPCLMCAMAFVHSRVRRIFYVYSSKNGALGARFKLHAVKELNHHYEVFQCQTLLFDEIIL